jgi:uncharacterized membrane protein YqaE (UPF0057 family)
MRKKLLIFGLPVLFSLVNTNAIAASSSKDYVEATTAVTNEPAIGAVQEAMKEFKSLSRHDKRIRIKEMKKALKQFKADKREGAEISTNTLLKVIIAIFIPPLAVYLHEGEITNRFWISVLLTVLGYLLFGFAGVLFLGSLPGIIYALIVILGG